MTGKAWQTAIRYSHTLCPRACYDHRVVFGFDFKQTNTDLEFGGLTALASSADIAQIVAGYHGLRKDGWGTLAVGGE